MECCGGWRRRQSIRDRHIGHRGRLPGRRHRGAFESRADLAPGAPREQTPDVQDEQVEGRTDCGERYPPDEPSPTSEEPSPTPEEPSPTPDESTETTG